MGKIAGFNISGNNLVGTDVSLKPNEVSIGTLNIPCYELRRSIDEEGNGNETETRLTIGSVNGGLDYIEHSAGISNYGKIWAVQVFDDVTPQILKDRGTSSLNSLVNLGVSIEIRAIDLNFVDNSESKLLL